MRAFSEQPPGHGSSPMPISETRRSPWPTLRLPRPARSLRCCRCDGASADAGRWVLRLGDVVGMEESGVGWAAARSDGSVALASGATLRWSQERGGFRSRQG